MKFVLWREEPGESTGHIRTMVEKLQAIAKDAETKMQQGREQTQLSSERATSMQSALDAIGQAIEVVQQQSAAIAVATQQQGVVAEDINLNIHRITQLMDSTASHTTELNTESKCAEPGSPATENYYGTV